MVRKAALIALVVFAAPLGAQDEKPMTEDEKPWFLKDGWPAKNAPRGFMIGTDGKVLIEIGTADSGSEYGMLLDDYEKRDPKWPKVWIYGFHQGDKSVAYRTSKQQISVDCQYKMITTTFFITFKADGSTMFENNYANKASPVVPGSLGEQWYNYACRPK